MLKNTTVVGIPTTFDLQFFKYWVEFLRPLHKINPRDSELMALLLYKRHQLSKFISDDDILDATLFSGKIKKEIRAELGITTNYFQVMLKHLRDRKAIVGNKINPKFIPKFEADTQDYKLLIQFSFNASK